MSNQSARTEHGDLQLFEEDKSLARMVAEKHVRRINHVERHIINVAQSPIANREEIHKSRIRFHVEGHHAGLQHNGTKEGDSNQKQDRGEQVKQRAKSKQIEVS